jgi:drug/metabolite transporter (DMT)-like permease
MQVPPEFFIGVTFGILHSLFSAAQTVLFKSQKDGITPTATNTIKMWVSFGTLALIAIIPFRPPTGPIPIDVVFILAVSVLFGATFGDLAYFTSQNRVGVSVAYPIARTFPVFTYIFSILFLNEQFYIVRMVGVVLAVVGVIMVSREEDVGKEPEESRTDGLDKIGLALAVLTSIMLAVASLLIQVGITETDPIDGSAVRLFYGALAMVPVFIISRRRGEAPPTKKATKIIILGSIFGFSFATLFFVASIKFAGATVTAVVTTTAPLFAMPLSFTYLKEHISPRAIGGTLVAVIGVVLAILGAW